MGITGTLFIVAAPSGGGKTTLVKALCEKMDNIVLSISHTTRGKKNGEKHGQDYFFIDETTFNNMIAKDAFLEHATVYGSHYGTAKEQILNNIKQGIDVILDIDWQGAMQIKKLFPNSVCVFIIPPSLITLRNRLQKRRRESNEIIDNRMAKARDEIANYKKFDYLIVNEDFEHALIDLMAIVKANRLLMERQVVKNASLLSLLLTKE